MPPEDLKDRIYYVAPETDDERAEREAQEEASKAAELERSGYGSNGRYWPGMERIWAKKDAEQEAEEARKKISAAGQ
jgi:hypothetical protein